MKDIIEDENGLIVQIRHKDTIEPSMIFCDKIVYMHDSGEFDSIPIFDHHLVFYSKRKLIFKVWLRNKHKDKEYRDIYEALQDVGIKIFMEHSKSKKETNHGSDISPVVYRLGREASRKVTERSPFFDDLFDMWGNFFGREKLSKPMIFVKRHFNDLMAQIHYTKDIKALKKLEKQVANLKIRVNKKISSEFYKEKRRALKLIKDKIKEKTKKKKK